MNKKNITKYLTFFTFYFLAKVKKYFQCLVKIRYPAGYPVSGHHRISGSGNSFAGLSGIRPKIHIRPNPNRNHPLWGEIWRNLAKSGEIG